MKNKTIIVMYEVYNRTQIREVVFKKETKYTLICSSGLEWDKFNKAGKSEAHHKDRVVYASEDDAKKTAKANEFHDANNKLTKLMYSSGMIVGFCKFPKPPTALEIDEKINNLELSIVNLKHLKESIKNGEFKVLLNEDT